MVNILNTFNMADTILITSAIIVFLLLIAIVIYLCTRNKYSDFDDINEDTVDDEFYTDLKEQDDNTKSVFVDNVDIDKVNKMSEEESISQLELETNTNENKIDNHADNKKINNTNSEKFDIGQAAKQIETDIVSNNIDLTEYEVEQEEKAIISYTELLNKVKKNALENKVKVQTVELEPKNDELEEFSYNTEILDFSDLNDSYNYNKENTSTLFKQDDIKEMLNIKDINTVLYSSDDFLKALKDLRDSLE